MHTTAKHPQRVKMTFDELDYWRTEQNLSIAAACAKLGISWNKWKSMRQDGAVPRTVELAAKAIYHRLDGKERGK